VRTLVPETMDQPQLTGQNLGQVFNFRNGHANAAHFIFYIVKLPNFKLKTRPKQPLGSLPLDIALPTEIEASAIHGPNRNVKLHVF
jgi:hypothetical protein